VRATSTGSDRKQVLDGTSDSIQSNKNPRVQFQQALKSGSGPGAELQILPSPKTSSGSEVATTYRPSRLASIAVVPIPPEKIPDHDASPVVLTTGTFTSHCVDDLLPVG
jgi:hypothetical protein